MFFYVMNLFKLEKQGFLCISDECSIITNANLVSAYNFSDSPFRKLFLLFPFSSFLDFFHLTSFLLHYIFLSIIYVMCVYYILHINISLRKERKFIKHFSYNI